MNNDQSQTSIAWSASHLSNLTRRPPMARPAKLMLDLDLVSLPADSPYFQRAFRKYLCEHRVEAVATIGDSALLQTNTLALFCSVKCPGRLIIATSDLARSLCGLPLTIIGGFHSPVEKECLNIFLRTRQPVIICLARGLEHIRLPRAWRGPISNGRLLILSATHKAVRRPSAGLAEMRNRVAAALADEICVAYATPGGKTEKFVAEVLGWAKPVFTLDFPENAALFTRGAKPWTGVDYEK